MSYESKWAKRLKEDCKKLSKHIRFKRIKDGFTRVYYDRYYVHEFNDNLPMHGYDFEIVNPRLDNKEFYEEYEDNIEAIRTVKNYVEGYFDAKKVIEIRTYMHRHDEDYNKQLMQAMDALQAF